MTSKEVNLTKTGLVSFETSLFVQEINFSYLCGAISLFGIPANIVNIIVFSKQGFKDSVNISLFGLAIADLACDIASAWTSVNLNPLFANSDLPFEPYEFSYVTTAIPHVCANRVSSFITAFITIERCLCITQPLRVKTIFTPARTKIIIVCIYAVMITVFSPFYFVNDLQWKFDETFNKTMIRLVLAGNNEIVEGVTFAIHSVFMSGLSLLIVIICTIILVINLNKKTKWRQSTTALGTTNPEAVSTKDKKVVKMITFISAIFIVCLVPATLISFMMAFEPRFSFTGQYRNIFLIFWSLAFVLQTINSSVNIFVYFNMSSKFRATFIQFCRRGRGVM